MIEIIVDEIVDVLCHFFHGSHPSVNESLKPFFHFKIKQGCSGCNHTDHDDKKIAVSPAKFRHTQIHATPSDDQRQREKYGCDNRKHFHDAVEIDIGLGLKGFSYLCDIISQVQYPVIQPVGPIGLNLELPQFFLVDQAILILLDCFINLQKLFVINLKRQKPFPKEDKKNEIILFRYN